MSVITPSVISLPTETPSTGATATRAPGMRSCASRLRAIAGGLPPDDTAAGELRDIAETIEGWARGADGPSPDYFLG